MATVNSKDCTIVHDGSVIQKLTRPKWDDLEPRKAAQFARNYQQTNNRERYARTKTNQHGCRLWTLVLIYAITIREVEAKHPDRCRAFVDAEAKRLIQAREAEYVQ